MHEGQPARLNRFLLVAACSLLFLNSDVSATRRFYRDIKTASPNGRYKLEAKSPHNAGGRPRAFARDFTYRLYDTEADRLIWKRVQPEREGSPTRIFVHDEMWVVVRTSRDSLIVLEPMTGDTVLQFSLLDEFPAEEQSQFVAWTTAGKKWAGRSRWSFLSQAAETYFVIRTWWDRRVITNLTKATLVRAPDPELLAALDSSDRRYVLDTLDGAPDRLQGNPEDYALLWPVQTAVHMAGRIGINDAIPHLRELEKSNRVGSSGGWGDIDGTYDDGDINPFSNAVLRLRRDVHLALRRLGEKPTELPCTWFRYAQSEGLGDYVEIKALPAPRADRAHLVRPGMKPVDVLDAIGAPDYVNFGEQAWEYDMDTDAPYTLRVYWRERTTVARVECVTPALWQQGETRYHQRH